MTLTTNQQLYLARRLAKQHGLFVASKPFGPDKPLYLLYRDLGQHHRPAPIGKRESAAALLALVEKVTDCPASWPSAAKPAHQPGALAPSIRTSA